MFHTDSPIKLSELIQHMMVKRGRESVKAICAQYLMVVSWITI